MTNALNQPLIHAEIVRAFNDQVKETRDTFRAIGCSGLSGFEDLPYYRYAVHTDIVFFPSSN
jgi:hypothetical protein